MVADISGADNGSFCAILGAHILGTFCTTFILPKTKKPPFIKVKVIRNTNFTMSGHMNLENVAEIDVEESAFLTRKLEKGDIILEKSGGSQTQAVGRVVYFDISSGLYSFSNFTACLRVINPAVRPQYLYRVLNEYYQRGKTFAYQNGMGGLKNLDMNRYMDIPIPVPPLSIQQQIVDECEKIEEEYNNTRMSIESYRKKAEELFDKLDVISAGGGYRLSLANPDDFDVSIGKRILNRQLVSSASVPVYSANVKEPFGHIDELLITDFSVPSVLWGIDGDWMVNYIPEHETFYPTDHCGVLRCKTEAVNPRYLAHLLEKEGKRMGFSRSYRASIDRIEGITFTVADRRAQDATVAEITAIEAQIKDAESTLNSLNGKTSDILNHYLAS